MGEVVAKAIVLILMAAFVVVCVIAVKDYMDSGGVYYNNCAEVKAAGEAPLHKGDPGFRKALDTNHNGIACEEK